MRLKKKKEEDVRLERDWEPMAAFFMNVDLFCKSVLKKMTIHHIFHIWNVEDVGLQNKTLIFFRKKKALIFLINKKYLSTALFI